MTVVSTASVKLSRKRRARTYPERVLKVVHTGEHGAVNIYRGQIFGARLTCPSYCDELHDFMVHEQRHRAIFKSELDRRGLRKCFSTGLCGLGGLVLGVVTGLMGRRAIAVTTVAVERTVLSHLGHYQAELIERDPEAYDALSAIVADEQEHHDATAREAGQPGPFLRSLAGLVSISTEAVIWTGMRI